MPVFIFALILCLAAAGMLFEARGRRADLRRVVPPGRLVQVGDLRLHLNCSGSGSPCIVFESGLGDSSLVWSEVQSAVSRNRRACSYDRAGIAWSEPGEEWNALLAVEQLHALLEQAGEAPPYVLVGHSAGASYARLFAHTYLQEVKALVLVEPPLLTEISPLAITLLKTMRSAVGVLSRLGLVRLLGRTSQGKILFGGSDPPPEVNAAAGFLYRPHSIRASIREVEALPDTIHQLQQRSGPGALRDLPVLVIAARSKSAPGAGLVERLEELSRLSSRGRVVFIPGSHFLHFEAPELLANYIEDVCEEQA